METNSRPLVLGEGESATSSEAGFGRTEAMLSAIRADLASP